MPASLLGPPISTNSFDRATANLKTNLTQIQALGQLWNSADVAAVYNSLTASSTTANVGSLSGNRMFYANDYMVRISLPFGTKSCTYSDVRSIAAMVT